MSITIRIDYGNGAEKSFRGLLYPVAPTASPPQPNNVVHVHDALEHAARTAPKLHYTIEPQWLGSEGGTNRAGWVPIVITEIDGVQRSWEISVNGQTIGLRKQMANLNILPDHSGQLADGDEVTISTLSSTSSTVPGDGLGELIGSASHAQTQI